MKESAKGYWSGRESNPGLHRDLSDGPVKISGNANEALYH